MSDAMKLHKIMPILLVFSVVLVSGCTQTTEPPPSGGATTGEVKEFDMTARQWEFIPGTITVNEGDTVILHVTSIDVAHGIGIPDFGVSEQLQSGQTVDIEFVADRKGTFLFSCTVFCGSGHSGMRGTLIVQ